MSDRTDRTGFRRLPTLLLGLLILISCAEAGDPIALATEQPSFASTGPVLVECPTKDEASITGILGVLGGILRLDGHALRLPLQAILVPTEFSVATPVSNYMELSVEARGFDSFLFNRTATITLDYSRCSRSNLDKAPLTVWQIDPDTKELLEHMGGVDDKVARTVTFHTDHLSTFSIAH